MSIFGDDMAIENLSIQEMNDSLACGFRQNERWSFLIFSWLEMFPEAWIYSLKHR